MPSGSTRGSQWSASRRREDMTSGLTPEAGRADGENSFRTTDCPHFRRDAEAPAGGVAHSASRRAIRAKRRWPARRKSPGRQHKQQQHVPAGRDARRTLRGVTQPVEDHRWPAAAGREGGDRRRPRAARKSAGERSASPPRGRSRGCDRRVRARARDDDRGCLDDDDGSAGQPPTASGHSRRPPCAHTIAITRPQSDWPPARMGAANGRRVQFISGSLCSSDRLGDRVGRHAVDLNRPFSVRSVVGVRLVKIGASSASISDWPSSTASRMIGVGA